MKTVNQALLISLASEAIMLSSTAYAASMPHKQIKNAQDLARILGQSSAKKLPVTPSQDIVKQALAEFFYKTPKQFLYEYQHIMKIASNADSTSTKPTPNQQDVVAPCYVESYTPCYSNHRDCGRGSW